MVTLQVALLWTIGYAFFVFHGLSFHLTPWSQAFINAIVKYSYGATGKTDTTVVLFREENLRLLGISYPVPYGIHAQVLEAIASYGPRAIFVDFAFIDDRPGEDELKGALCALKPPEASVSIPVFLAAPAGATVRAKLVECARMASPEIDENVGVSGVLTYPPRARAGGPRTAAFELALTNPTLGLDDHATESLLEIIWGKGVRR